MTVAGEAGAAVASETDELLSRPDGPAHRLTLNRPARRNALTPELALRLAQAVEKVGDEGRARAIIVEGAGGHFCVGLDLHWFQSISSDSGGPPVQLLQRGLHQFQSAVLAIARSPLPVIALLSGTSAGFGLDLALACDIRLAAQSATVTSAFARMGLVPDGGSTFTLPALVGSGRALRFMLSGDTLDATAAHSLGLVDDVVDDAALHSTATRLVASIAMTSEPSARTIKRLLRAEQLGALEQALAAEGAAQLQALQSEDFAARRRAFAARGGTGSSGAPA